MDSSPQVNWRSKNLFVKLGRCIRLSVLFVSFLQPGHDGVRKVQAYRSIGLCGQNCYRRIEPAAEPHSSIGLLTAPLTLFVTVVFWFFTAGAFVFSCSHRFGGLCVITIERAVVCPSCPNNARQLVG
jgi:hypothetical protein